MLSKIEAAFAKAAWFLGEVSIPALLGCSFSAAAFLIVLGFTDAVFSIAAAYSSGFIWQN